VVYVDAVIDEQTAEFDADGDGTFCRSGSGDDQ
jgi:hypothetical protein